MNEILALTVGVACAAAGGELFVRGAVSMAHWLRVSPGIIGATVAAFATSSPELSVSVSSALAGTPQIALGDALGSNVVNVALILGLALAVSGIKSSRGNLKRDFPVAVVVPVITGLLFLDGVLSRLDGLLMLGMFLAWIVATIIEARNQRSSVERVLGGQRLWVALAHGLAGLALLVAAGNLIVAGAKGLALAFGINEFVVGATLVAMGTSAPELATVLVAKLRGHDEISLGTILGSNIFNGLFIVAVAASIHPIVVDWREVAIALTFGLLALGATFPTGDGLIARRRGILLLALYAAYVVTLVQWHAG